MEFNSGFKGLNNKFVTALSKCSKISPSTSVQPRNSYAKIACCSSVLIFTFLHASSIIQSASEQLSLLSTSLCKLPFSSKPTNKILTEGGEDSNVCLSLSNRSEPDTRSYESLAMIHTVTSQNIDLYS